jgi:hypothetical protein
MKRYIYRTLKTADCSEDAQDTLAQELSKLGREEGWEVIQILVVNYSRKVDGDVAPSEKLVAYLKREFEQ